MKTEDIFKRNINSKVFKNGDGTQTVSVFSMPVHYQDEQGVLQDIDLAIIDNKNAMPRIYDYVTRANSFTTGFRGSAAEKQFLRFVNRRGQGGALNVSILGLFYYDFRSGQKTLIEAPKTSGPIVAGNKITYPEIFTGVSLEFISQEIQLKENIYFSESFKQSLPDPVSLGFNRDAVKVVIGLEITSQNGKKRSDNKIAFLGQDGAEQFWLDEITAEDAQAWEFKTFDLFSEATDEYYYGLSYPDFREAAYPVTLDPTLYVSTATDGFIRKALSGGTLTRYTGQSTCKAGCDGTYNYRHFTRFNMATQSIAGQTLANALYSMYLTNVGSTELTLEEVSDWGTLDTADWGISVYEYRGIIGGTNLTYNSCDTRNSVLATAGSSWVAFRTRGTSEPTTNTGGLVVTLLHGQGGTYKPKLEWTSYTTFTQNSATAGNGQVTVNWENTAGGLQAGDYRRVYYKAGTGLDAATIKAAGTYVTVTDVTSTSVTVTGLSGGTNYCFVITETMIDGSQSEYAGAESNVVEATPTGAGGGTATSLTVDSERKIRKVQALPADTARQVAGDSALTRTMSGLLLADYFSTDSLVQYTQEGFASTFDGTNGQIVMGSDAYPGGSTRLKYMDNLVQDVIVQAKYYFPTTYTASYNVSEGNGLELMTRIKSDGSHYAYKLDFRYNYNDMVGYGAGAADPPAYNNSLSLDIPAQAWYCMKMRLTGSNMYGKMWLASNSEPASWNINTTETNITGTGGFGIRAVWKQVYITEFFAYKANTITVTNLPTGYKTRVAGNIATESSGTATLTLEHITFPQSQVEIIDASDVIVDTFFDQGNVWGGDVYAYGGSVGLQSITVDTERTRQAGVNALPLDTYRKDRRTESLAGDSYRLARRGDTIGADTTRKTLKENSLAAATKRKPSILSSLAADGSRLLRAGSSLVADTLKKTTNSEILGIDTFRKAVASAAYPLDTFRKVVASGDQLTDTVRKLTRIAALGADSNRKTRREESLAADSLRKPSLETILGADTARVVSFVMQAAISTDLLRKVQVSISPADLSVDTYRKRMRAYVISIDTKRAINRVEAIAAYTYRRVRLNASLAADTYRKTRQQTGDILDTVRILTSVGQSIIFLEVNRKVVKTENIQADTFKKTMLETWTDNIDSDRNIRGLTSLEAETQRKPTNDIGLGLDATRKTLVNVGPVLDTVRKVAGITGLVIDTLRKPAITVTLAGDTARNLFSVITAVVNADTARAVVTKSLRKGSAGFLTKDLFTTNTLTGYGVSSQGVTWNSAGYVRLGQDQYLGQGSLYKKTVDYTDCVVLARVTLSGTYAGNPYFRAYLRQNGTSWYYLELNRVQNKLFLFRTNTALGSSPYTYATGTKYAVKLSCVGQAVQAKSWQNSSSEPTSWGVSVANDTGSTHGYFGFEAKEGFADLDEYYVYKSDKIVFSGLNYGEHKVRIGGLASTVTDAATDGTAVVDCQHITFPLAYVEILDVGNNVISRMDTEVWGGDAYTFSVNSVVASLFTDSVRRIRKIESGLLFDTKRKSVNTLSLVADTLRTVGISVYVNTAIDTVRRIGVNTSIAAVDTYRKVRRSEVVVTDILRKLKKVFTVPADINRKTIRGTGLILDSARYVKRTTTLVSDIFRKTRRAEVIPADTFRSKRRSETVPFDSLRKTRRSEAVPADSLRKTRRNEAVTIDSKRRLQVLLDYVTDSMRKVVQVANYGADVFRKVIRSENVAADSFRYVIAFVTEGIPLDTLRKLTQSYTLTEDTRRNAVNTAAPVLDTFRKLRRSETVGSEIHRRLRKETSANMDAVRRIGKVYELAADSARRLRNSLTVGADSYRKVRNSAVIPADSYRKLRKLSSLAAATRRKVVNSTSTIGDTRRKTRIITGPVVDSTRRLRINIAGAIADTYRKTRLNVVLTGDTVVRLRAIYKVTADTYRNLRYYGIELITDTRRRVVRSSNAVVDAVRKIRRSETVAGDSYRKLRNNLTMRADLRREVTLYFYLTNIPMDTVRRIRKATSSTTDSERRLLNTIGLYSDTIRRLRSLRTLASETVRVLRNNVALRADTVRRRRGIITVPADVTRRLAGLTLVAADTSRKPANIVYALADLLRSVTSFLLRKSLDYVITEVPDRYAVTELDGRYAAIEREDNITWKEDSTDMKEFILGESKEVAIELEATDGSNFLIESANYVYKTAEGTVLKSGGASVQGKKVFILLTPTEPGYSQKIMFTITTQPLDQYNQPDPSRNDETIKPSVIVNVLNE